MDPLQPNTALLPPALRALALGLLIETGVSLLNRAREENPVMSDPGEGELWQTLRCKCGELSALVLRAHDPGEAATYVLGYLPKHFDYVLEQVYGRKRRPAWGGPEAGRPAALGQVLSGHEGEPGALAPGGASASQHEGEPGALAPGGSPG